MEVVECSATDLVGQYVGQTGPKTIKQLERGLGKVLFIDEAYRLGQGQFAKEAIDELVDNITKPRFAGKMVIILAGYDKDMNNLLRVNEGLSSRFADEILFPSLQPEDCLQLLKNKLKESQIHFPSIQDPIVNDQLLELIAEMSRLPSWGNARDVQTLAKSMVRAVYQKNTTKVDQLLLPANTALDCIHSMLSERRARAKETPQSRPDFSGPVQSQDDSSSVPLRSSGTSTATNTAATAPKTLDCILSLLSERRARAKETPQSRPDFSGLVQSQDDSSSVPPRSSGTSTATNTAARAPKKNGNRTPKKRSPEHQGNPDEGRDLGVSDAIWQQLQKDKKEAQLQIERTAQKIKEQAEAHRLAKAAEKKAKEAAERLRQIKAKNDAEAFELLRKREDARILEMRAKAERERILRELERKKREEEERRKKEEKAQRKLQELGVCIMGFQWIKQAGGYRCAGGFHWVHDSQLNL